jgi:hypothetical protein
MSKPAAALAEARKRNPRRDVQHVQEGTLRSSTSEQRTGTFMIVPVESIDYQ